MQPHYIIDGVIVCPVLTDGADPQPIPRQWKVHCVLRDGDIAEGEIISRHVIEQWPVAEAAEIRGEYVMVPILDDVGHRVTQSVVVGQTAWSITGGQEVVIGGKREDTPESALAVWEEAQNAPPEPASPTRWMVPKLAVVERLETAGLRIAAKQALAQDDYQQDRWDAATEIASDDQAVRALLTGIGADPDAILARP